jgi:hypothetical protein
VDWHTVLVQNPLFLLPQVRHFLPHWFSELGRDLQVVLLINRLTLRYPTVISLLMLKTTIIIAFTFSRSSTNSLRHSKTRARDITLSPYTSFNSWKHSVGVFFFFFKLTRNFRLMRCSIFILVTNSTEQHNMITLKQSSEANQLI